MTQAPTTSSRKPTLKRGSKPYIFHIASQSRPGLYHVTDALHMTCTCEAGRLGRLCWHVRLGVQAYDWWKRQSEQRKAERAGKQATNWSSAPAPATQSAPAPAPATGSAVAPLRQTGDLPPLSRWFE